MPISFARDAKAVLQKGHVGDAAGWNNESHWNVVSMEGKLRRLQ